MSPKQYATKLYSKYHAPFFENNTNLSLDALLKIKWCAIDCALMCVEEMLNNELLTDLLQLPDDSPHKYKAIYQKMWLTDVKNELLKQQNNG
jgi:hypothetical protein